MEAILLPIIAWLVCFASGHIDEKEFGRYQSSVKSPRRHRVAVLDRNSNKQARQRKQINWLVKER